MSIVSDKRNISKQIIDVKWSHKIVIHIIEIRNLWYKTIYKNYLQYKYYYKH